MEKKLEIDEYKVFYYLLAIERVMLGKTDEKFFSKFFENEEFFQILLRFIGNIQDNNTYPLKFIERLERFVEKLRDNTNGEWYLKYEIILNFLKIGNFENSNEYLEDAKKLYHGFLKDSFSKIDYTDEQIEDELKDSFYYYDLLLNCQLTSLNLENFEHDNFLLFIRVLMQESSNIIDVEKYKKQILYCLNEIVNNSNQENLKKQARYLIYQVNTGIYKELGYTYNYQEFNVLFEKEEFRKKILNPDVKMNEPIFSDEQIFSDVFKSCIEDMLDDMLSEDGNINIDDSQDYFVKHKIIDYLSIMDFEYRKDVSNNKENIKWVNEQKIKVNSLTANQITSYMANDIMPSFFSRKDRVSFLKSGVKENLSIQYYTDIAFLKSIFLSPDKFDEAKDILLENEYLLFTINKYLYYFKEMFVDPIIFERTIYLVNETLKRNNKIGNVLKVKSLKKKLSSYYEEKSL